MQKLLLFIICLFIFSCNTFNEDKTDEFQKEITFLNTKSDSLTIKDILLLYKKGDFSIPIGTNVFHNLENLENTWLHFNTKNINEDHFLSIWSTYLKTSQIYIADKDSLVTLENHQRYLPLNKRNTHYRLPTWKIEKKHSNTDIFIKLNDSDRYTTSLKFLFLNQNDFLKLSQTDSYFTMAIIIFLVILALIIIILFATQKRNVMLWYAGYIFFVITDYMVFKGIWDNEILFSNAFLFENLKSIAQASCVFFASMFFSKFYPFDKKTKIYAQLFKIIAITSLFVILVFAFNFFINNPVFELYWLWIILRVCVLFIIITHLVLIIKKVLPTYLGIAFLLSTVFSLIHFNMEPSVNVGLQGAVIIENFFYMVTVLETVLVTFYIINEIVKEKMLAVKLRQENLELRNNFQNTLLKSQHQERNKLVGNVHDTFGGYLEALKLRLLQKNENTPEKVQEILDAFYKDYRYLLNSLYAPKVNSENFVENLIDFCEKLNNLSESKISHQFILENSELSQEKCLHLYRIISELVTNAIKHAKASEIKIDIKQNNLNEIILQVKDNGIGFETDSIKQKGFGLNSIKQRVEQIGAAINIDSNSLGTNIKITILKNE
jgi:signal transduction histidine kinase